VDIRVWGARCGVCGWDGDGDGDRRERGMNELMVFFVVSGLGWVGGLGLGSWVWGYGEMRGDEEGSGLFFLG
jgi:hypothetical protein